MINAKVIKLLNRTCFAMPDWVREILLIIIMEYMEGNDNPHICIKIGDKAKTREFLKYMRSHEDGGIKWETDDDRLINIRFFDALVDDSAPDWDGMLWVSISAAFGTILENYR